MKREKGNVKGRPDEVQQHKFARRDEMKNWQSKREKGASSRRTLRKTSTAEHHANNEESKWKQHVE